MTGGSKEHQIRQAEVFLIVFQLMCVCVCSLFRISFGCCGRFTLAELLSFSLSVMLVLIWVLTGHWLLMDGASPSLSLFAVFIHSHSCSLEQYC